MPKETSNFYQGSLLHTCRRELELPILRHEMQHNMDLHSSDNIIKSSDDHTKNKNLRRIFWIKMHHELYEANDG